ncbi:MAG: hypothetical protein JO133_07320 [Burkholderiaceae bacterium]|nr:hypothetical protein [Burkholderiaceae bacterium]
MQRPRPALLLALAGSAGLSALALFGDDPNEVIRPAERAIAPALATIARDARPVGNPAAISFRLGTRPAASDQPRDLFAAYSWLPPPPPPASSPAQAAPQAPPVPFTYGGSIGIPGKVLFVLIEGVRTYVVSVGDQAGDFQLQSVSSSSLVFLHVPTGLEQTLAVPGAPIMVQVR